MAEVVLVDEFDRPIGFEEKIEAHRNGGKLHRAFSIFIFNSRGEMLLQRRAARKYHFARVWANACCGHPSRGETLEAAAHRRLGEEVGFDTELRRVFSFIYCARDARSGLTERELDHVFAGEFDGSVQPAPSEIDELRWVDCADLLREVTTHPARFAPWFLLAVERLAELSSAAPARRAPELRKGAVS
jgi:isopentenyl-diphosphate delta-isomerase